MSIKFYKIRSEWDLKEKIQFINYSGEFESENFVVNNLSSPESFDDYDINIIDLSSKEIWRNDSAFANSINSYQDIKNISIMLHKINSKILVVLPQNLEYEYALNYINEKLEYLHSLELKNCLSLVNMIIEKLLNISYERNWLLYSRTKSLIANKEFSSDFVFRNFGKIVTLSASKTLITTILTGGITFTTLNLQTEKDFQSMFEQLKWTTTEEVVPEWIKDVNFFNDNQLRQDELEKEEQLKKITLEMSTIKNKLNENLFYKSILYKTGESLVEVVNVMLKDMLNYNYENFVDEKEEDFLINYDDKYFIGEIKGVNSNITRSIVSQTATHRDLFLEKEGNQDKKAFAIAIINRQKNKNLVERDFITEDVINLAKSNDVLIIPAEQFLKLYEMFKNNQITSSKIVDLLSSQKGVINLELVD